MPQFKLGLLAFKILGPIAVVIGLLLYHNHAVNGAYDDGVDSRNEEVATLTSERDTALIDIDTLKGDLGRCRDAKTQAEADVTSLNSKLAAQTDEHKTALKLQAENFASAQRATSNAMETLARNAKAADIGFAGILEQLKGVNYDYDKNTGRCVITGGGRVLRNAAKGKIGN